MTTSSYSIQDFVTRTLESCGAVVEQVGFGLIEVLLPDTLAESFEHKNNMLLAFDYEVAQETPDSEFVTFGSYLLDRVIGLALARGRLVRMYVPVERLEPPANIEEQLEQKLSFMKCRPPRLKDWAPMEYGYYSFDFRCIYQYDEKQEEVRSVLVDTSTGRQDAEVQLLFRQLEKIIPLGQRQHILPHAPEIPPAEAYVRACAAVKRQTVRVKANIEREQAPAREKELGKVTDYYQNTAKDLQRRLDQNQDTGRKEKIEKQIAATLADQKRRQQDIKEKYAVNAEIYPDSLVIYRLPKLNLQLEVQQRNETFSFPAVFNTLTREVEAPLCPCCGLPAKQLMRVDKKIHCGCGG